MSPHHERIRPCEDCDQWHGKDGNYGARDPRFKVQTSEPILLRWPRVENKEPKTEFWEVEFLLWFVGAHRHLTFKMGYPESGQTVA